MNLNYIAELTLLQNQRLLSFAGFLIFCSILAGLYFLITWKMKPKFRSGFNKFLVIIFFSASAVFLFDMTMSLITISQVNHQLGFSYSTPETPEGEIFEVLWVTKGKTMERAGLKSMDRILMHNVNDLYRLLIANQGKEILIPIRRENREMEIKVLVPVLKVPLGRLSFLTL